MSNTIDTVIALRVLYLFNLPFKKWPAFKDGTIDENGKVVKKPSTQNEKDNWTILHKLVSKLKRIIAKAPGGSSIIATLAASYLAIKEDVENVQFAMDQLYDAAPELMEEIALSSCGSVSGPTNSMYDPNVKTPKAVKAFKIANQKQKKTPRRILGFKEWIEKD